MRALTLDTRTQLLKEQYIPDNLFIYVVKGSVEVFDGAKSYTLRKGQCCIARKNRLAKYRLLDSDEIFDPILFCFDEPYLHEFLEKHPTPIPKYSTSDAFILLQESELLTSFIQSVKPYYIGVMQLDEAFEDIKYEELLIILLQNNPELAAIFFNFTPQAKINLEAFMNENYKFNVNLSQFAELTGRSLSGFKRDFKTTFNISPGKWLIQRRLEEAYFLISKQHKKPVEIYLELGFESLSHFSYAFKQKYGCAPSAL